MAKCLQKRQWCRPAKPGGARACHAFTSPSTRSSRNAFHLRVGRFFVLRCLWSADCQAPLQPSPISVWASLSARLLRPALALRHVSLRQDRADPPPRPGHPAARRADPQFWINAQRGTPLLSVDGSSGSAECHGSFEHICHFSRPLPLVTIQSQWLGRHQIDEVANPKGDRS